MNLNANKILSFFYKADRMNIAKRTQISSQDDDQALSIEPQSRVQNYTVPA